MTPLAQRFARELTTPIRDRSIRNDKAKLLERLEDMHCFDVSHVWGSVETALDEQNMWPTIAALLPTTFLPSPRTWLEIPFTVSDKKNRKPTGMRGHLALFLEQRDGWLSLDIAMQTKGAYDVYPEAWSQYLGRARPGAIFETERLITEAHRDVEVETQGMTREEACQLAGGSFYRLLATAVLVLDIINQPALCHLKVHQPHRGLEQRLRKGGVGRYPLLAWHEVLIKPQDRPLTEAEIEGHLTGRKCLHFVRQHRRRYRDGRETRVIHHWRGDPALGIKRTRYVVGKPG